MDKSLVQYLGPSKYLINVTYYYKNNRLLLNEEVTYFQLTCPCCDLFPPLHASPLVSPLVQKLFGDYFCPRIGIWEDSKMKPTRL